MPYPPLEDESLMPYGKHKGTQMIDLPINYLIWVLDESKDGNVKDWAKKNEKWIRAENATGKHNRPVRVAESSKPQPSPIKMNAIEFACQELKIDYTTDIGDLSVDGIPIADIARIAERYKNYFNGTPNLKPLPKEQPKKEEPKDDWADGFNDGVTITADDIPF